MKYWKYIWGIIVNIVVLLIALSVYGYANSYFETILLSLVIIIYIQLVSSSAITSRLILGSQLGMYFELNKIRTLLKNEPNKDEIEETESKIKEIAGDNILFYINMFFNSVLFIIAVWHLVFIII